MDRLVKESETVREQWESKKSLVEKRMFINSLVPKTCSYRMHLSPQEAESVIERQVQHTKKSSAVGKKLGQTMTALEAWLFRVTLNQNLFLL